MKNIAIIPILSRSERIKHKNIKLLAGYPLIYYQIECAKKVNGIQKIVVVTDNEQYGEIAKQYSVEVIILPPDITGLYSKSEDVLLNVLSKLKGAGEVFDNVILLQTANPLNRPEFLQKGLEMLDTGNYNSILAYYDFGGILLNDHNEQFFNWEWITSRYDKKKSIIETEESAPQNWLEFLHGKN